ncbi:hypothetical protein ALC62_08051 [Cyphomyrmex costatus]|uniref:Uncharacterized protein n=1 Tax=Cyphomyrmex costatus TaxID=456900 RepID=A0A195CKH4_9HYME|nr:hypothetical protein ALC62_08051 [Cyphomyrmex costatus]
MRAPSSVSLLSRSPVLVSENFPVMSFVGRFPSRTEKLNAKVLSDIQCLCAPDGKRMASRKTRQNHSIQHLLELPSNRESKLSRFPVKEHTQPSMTTPRQVPVTVLHPSPKKVSGTFSYLAVGKDQGKEIEGLLFPVLNKINSLLRLKLEENKSFLSHIIVHALLG